jgi:hypothetical protein
MKRFPGLLPLVFMLAALPAFARVISYAPYTNRVALPSVQDRTARHFVLLESDPEYYTYRSKSDVLLYDSGGAEEPRVITPAASTVYEQAALYEKPGAPPLILVLGSPSYSSRVVAISEGGTVWRNVEGLGTLQFDSVLDVDTGGPYTGGLFSPITIGNDAWPFVITLRYNGVWAISRTGEAKALYNGADARLIGRNAAGTQFLIHAAGAIYKTTIDGPAVKVADAPAGPAYAGWITSNGTVYVETLRSIGRWLSVAANGALQEIAAAYEGTAASRGSGDFTPIRFLAVPTHDYEGAWIIQRAPGRPTTLSRHTPAGGMQTMWSDATGPQVEALIPGASGQTVLLQVHRERESAELAKPFLDPALAVWRVGQPAPRDYDELYLVEKWNKGFVHIDPDRFAGGDPFVFNSGFEEIEAVPVSRVSAPLSSGADVIQEWGVVRGSLKQRLVLPGVARLSGAFASFWMTDVTLYNPLAENQQVEMRFVPTGLEETVSKTVTLDPYEIRAIPDALRSLFFIDNGGGTLHLLPEVGINAIARTYSRKGKGTFGYGMQAIDAFASVGPRFPVSFAGAFPGSGFRTNLLLTDTSGRGAAAKFSSISFFAGSIDGEMAAPASGTAQINGTVPSVALNSVVGRALVVEATRGTAIATVVAIDNATNDPTYFPPDLPGSIPRAIPVIGHLDGANGARFRSDLYLYNPAPRYRTVTLMATRWDTGARVPAILYIGAHESRVIPDVLRTLFNMEGVARLTYSSADYEPAEGVRVTSRTYTVDANGGTYGCLVPPLNSFQIATAGDRLEILGISGGPGFRTNIGLVDLSDASIQEATVRLSIIDDRHRVLDVMTVSVPRRGGMQLNDVFTTRRITLPPAALLVVEVLDGKQIGAYATITDNVTNDSTYLGAQLGAQPAAN